MSAPQPAGAFGSSAQFPMTQLNSAPATQVSQSSQPSVHRSFPQPATGPPQSPITPPWQHAASTSHLQTGAQVSQAAVPQLYGSVVATGGVPGETYEMKLLSLMNELETNCAPPDVAVRALWIRLSSAERARFRAELPQFEAYLPRA